MARFEPLYSVQFSVALESLPRLGKSLPAGGVLLGPMVKSLGCVEDWRGGFVVVEPRDRPGVCLVPYGRVTDLAMGMESTRDERSPLVNEFASAARASTPLQAATFSKDLPGVLPGGLTLTAGVPLDRSMVRAVVLKRALQSTVCVTPLDIDEPVVVAMAEVLQLLLLQPESAPS